MSGLSAEQRETLATELEGHMSERDFEQGCAMLCGYDGDDRALHLAAALAPLVAGWLGEERERIAAAIEAGVLPSHPNQGYRDGHAHAAQIARETA